MPSGELTYLTLASDTASQQPQTDPEERREHRFAIRGRSLRPGRNVLAAEVHQSGPDSSDLGFELRLLGSDHSPSA